MPSCILSSRTERRGISLTNSRMSRDGNPTHGALWILRTSSCALPGRLQNCFRRRLPRRCAAVRPIEVFPLSFPEYLRFNGVFKKIPRAGFTAREKGVLRRAMSEYMERGGFPDVQDVSDGMRASMLQGYVDAVLYRDIIERHAVPSVQALKYTLEYLFHNYARKASTRSISGVLKNLSLPANRESIADYLDWFKDAYLAYLR